MKIYDTWPQLSSNTKHSLFSTVCFHFPNRYFFLCSEWDFVHPCKLMKGILSTIANHEGFLSTCANLSEGDYVRSFFVRIQSSMYGMTSLGSSGSKQIIVWVETVQIMGWNVWTGEGWNVLISWVEVSLGWSVFIWNKGLKCLWVESSLSRTQYLNQQLL